VPLLPGRTVLRMRITPSCRSMIFFDNARPNPGAVAFLGSEEWFKNLVGMLGSNTVPVVGNYEADLILQFSGPQIKYSAVRQCIQGVHDQIRHDLQHLARMHLRYQVPWQILDKVYLLGLDLPLMDRSADS
jgi:hypothetical protein